MEPATLFQQYATTLNAKLGIPFVKLMRIAVALHNKGQLFQSEIAGDVLRLSDLATIETDEVRGIIKAVQNPSKLPETWASAFFDVVLRLEGIDLTLLSDFWAAVNGDASRIWLQSMPNDGNWSRQFAIVTELLRLKDDAALDLATGILRHCPEVPSEIAYEMNRRAALGLLTGHLADARRDTLVQVVWCGANRH